MLERDINYLEASIWSMSLYILTLKINFNPYLELCSVKFVLYKFPLRMHENFIYVIFCFLLLTFALLKVLGGI